MEEDTGTNDPVLTTEDSQGTSTDSDSGALAYQPPANGIQVFDDGSSIQTFEDGSTMATGSDGSMSSTNATDTFAQITKGFGAPSEDAGTITRALTEATINSTGSLGSKITPQSNVLDKFSSYTYALSWYLITPEQFKALSVNQRINTNQWSLLMQSGGAASTQTGVAAAGGILNGLFGGAQASTSTGRNKYFGLDYYMDNLIIETSFNNLAMSTVNHINFTVTEPNGITLLQNLAHAVQDMYKDTKVSAKDAFYVMAIKFYGYDSMGKQLTLSGLSQSSVIKYFPFTITDFDFKAASRAVEYAIKGAPLSEKTGKSSALGSIPQNFNLVGETVEDLLNGKVITNEVADEAGDRGSQNKSTASAGSSTNAKPSTNTTRDKLATSVFTGGAVNDTDIGYNVGATFNGA